MNWLKSSYSMPGSKERPSCAEEGKGDILRLSCFIPAEEIMTEETIWLLAEQVVPAIKS
jgi:hypothetical protein